MKRKSLFALALLLILSTVAFSNERSRFHCRTSGNLPCACASPASTTASHHLLLRAFFKLLYI
ncbi:MAG TPA: hypothetical protein VG101_09890 [Puia sp.]|jgi:hypothetical protein|nr:hypothetical protein [Puia sp.]